MDIKPFTKHFLISALILLSVTLVVNLIGLLTPYWIRNGSDNHSIGLFAECHHTDVLSKMKCTWYGIGQSHKQHGFMALCRGMMCIGSALLIVCAIGSSVICFNWKRRGACCALTFAFSTLFSACLILMSVILFGAENKELINNLNSSLDWSFYLSLLSLILSCVTCSLFTLSAVGLRKQNPYMIDRNANGHTNELVLAEDNNSGAHTTV